MSNDLKTVLKKRDDLTNQEAAKEVSRMKEDIFESLGNGASYDDIEEMMLSEGLEMDYIEDLIF